VTRKKWTAIALALNQVRQRAGADPTTLDAAVDAIARVLHQGSSRFDTRHFKRAAGRSLEGEWTDDQRAAFHDGGDTAQWWCSWLDLWKALGETNLVLVAKRQIRRTS